MKKFLCIQVILIILLFESIALCYNEVTVQDWTPYAYENITVTTTAISRPSVGSRNVAGALFLTVEDNNINYRIDGGNPTATLGHAVIAATYQNFWLNDRSAIRNLRMIAVGGNAIVKITYYRRQ